MTSHDSAPPLPAFPFPISRDVLQFAVRDSKGCYVGVAPTFTIASGGVGWHMCVCVLFVDSLCVCDRGLQSF